MIYEFSKEEFLSPGVRSCPGCAAVLTVRLALKILGSQTIVAAPAGCLATVGASNLRSAWRVPFVHTLFESVSAITTGIRHGLDALGKEDIYVVAFAGDSASLDIGFQALSGAAARNENILHICYDNEVAMNTGGQANLSSPHKAITPTTPLGSIYFKKNGPRIMAEHGIPYVATASVSHPEDFMQKVFKAKKIKGMRYIHVLAPCFKAWGFESKNTIKVAKSAVESGLWALYEIEDRHYRVSYKPRLRTDVKSYLLMQARFSHLTEDDIKQIQREVDKYWSEIE